MNFIESFIRDGYVVCPRWLSASELQSAHAGFSNWIAQGKFKSAGIGREQNHQVNESIRGDETVWIDHLAPPQEFIDIFRKLSGIKDSLNREAWLGILDLEVQLARYSPGAFYKRHLDRHQEKSARQVSMVLYLNQNWGSDDGGELVLYEHDQEITRVSPEGGTLVLFLSNDFPHEVLPAKRERRSMVGWFLSERHLI